MPGYVVAEAAETGKGIGGSALGGGGALRVDACSTPRRRRFGSSSNGVCWWQHGHISVCTSAVGVIMVAEGMKKRGEKGLGAVRTASRRSLQSYDRRA